MYNSRIYSLLICVLLVSGSVMAQTNRYMVFFKDKEGTPFRLDNPLEFLSKKAVDRRTKAGIAITEDDLPVNPAYLEEIASQGADIFYTSRWFNGALVQLDENRIPNLLALSSVENVEYIGPDALLSHTQTGYTLPESFSAPSSIDGNSELQLGMLNVDDMHDDGYRGEGIIMAVLDGGFPGVNQFTPFETLFEENRLIAGLDLIRNSGNPFQYSDHGTQVLSCIASEHENLTGAAPKASYILAVTEDVQGEYRIEEYNWVIAAEFADSAGADIIQSSVGYSTFSTSSMSYTVDDMDGQSTVVTLAANMAMERGILVVTSVGNEGRTSNSWRLMTAPADAFDILAVGGVGPNYERLSFSSIGPTADGRIKPDVMALGEDITMMDKNGKIADGPDRGTSFSSPLISGLAAGIMQAHPEWNNYQVAEAIRLSSSRSLRPDSLYGYGIPDYTEAVLGKVLSVDDMLSRHVTVFPNPFTGNRLFIDLPDYAKAYPLTIDIFDLRGVSYLHTTIETYADEDPIELEVDIRENGIYLLKLTSNIFSKRVKLMKN